MLLDITDTQRIDLVVVKYSTSINYYSFLNLTKVDICLWLASVLICGG